MKIYLAGPLFTTAEREFNIKLAGWLRQAGHEVWLPQENEPRDAKAAAIFRKDVEGMDWADVVVANMDGPDPDSGTCWECGYSYKKKPVIVFRTDFRVGDDPKVAPYNLMLTESADICLNVPVSNTETVVKQLIEALRTVEARTRG